MRLLPAALAAALAAAPATLHAQAAPPPANRAALAGVVRTVDDVPVAQAEVVLLGRRGGVRTDSLGRFSLEGVAPGNHDVMIRRLGFASVTFEWPAEGGVRVDIAVTLRPLPARLDPVVVSERESRALRGRSTVVGRVVDSTGAPVTDVEVQLVGSGRRTLTGPDGGFVFRRVPQGEFTVAARRLGYTPSRRAIYMTAEEEEREVVLFVSQVAQTLDPIEVEARSGFGRDADALRELDTRLRWFAGSSARAVIVGPDVLQQMGRASISLLIDARGGVGLAQLQRMRRSRGARSMQGGGAPTLRADIGAVQGDACILLNGVEFAEAPIGHFTADMVERVEYYPEGTEISGTVRSRMQGSRCAGFADNHPPYYVIWLKGRR